MVRYVRIQVNIDKLDTGHYAAAVGLVDEARKIGRQVPGAVKVTIRGRINSPAWKPGED